MDNNNVQNSSDNTKIETILSVMQYYQEEFLYRHQHYWNVLVKLFIFDVIIVVLPITTEAMGFALSDDSKKVAIIFPFVGIAIAFLTKIILEDEAKKISAVNKAKYEINATLPELYRYRNYVSDKNDKKVQLAHHLVKIVFWVEFIIAILVLVMICI